ncbi:hypothetical protein [Rhodococcus sp. NPDC057529]|uniref:hypothetical protein n=1 Tax=Rhodococcus sp. NPDC057529 TaxID=3346158 RepID=UPI00366E503E
MSGADKDVAEPRRYLVRDVRRVAQIVCGVTLSVAFWWGSAWVVPSELGLHWSITGVVLPLIAAFLVAGVVYVTLRQLRMAVVAFLAGTMVVGFLALVFNVTMGTQ